MQRLKYHFEPKKGWINDPNGLVFFKGRYHAFFQHNPHAPVWGPMHWGHAVSDDLIHWEELPIALLPDQAYENTGGCFSGSAVVKDDLLYLFYTSVSEEGQTQSLATSDDGVNFRKYENNPIIRQNPAGSLKDFRDPKVTKIGDSYYMVLGTGVDGVGKCLLFESKNLYDWSYVSTLLEGMEYGPVVECPDFFMLGDKYVLMVSLMKQRDNHVRFLVGDFDKKIFKQESVFHLDVGPDFYAPQTFEDENGRRIMIGWMYSWRRPEVTDRDYCGALSIPRGLTFKEGVLYNFPVKEALPLLVDTDEHIIADGDKIVCFNGKENVATFDISPTDDIKILRDTETVEIFLGGGSRSATFWLEK